MSEKERPVFVVGCPRSGNTIMGTLLNRHPDFFILFETNVLQSFYLKKWSSGEHRYRDNPKTYFARVAFRDLRKFNNKFGVSREDIRDCLESSPPEWKAMMATYMDLLRERAKPEATRWGDKTPHHVAFLTDIFELYPDAQVLWVYRDPRHVVTSLSKSSFPFTSDQPIHNAEVVRQYLDVYRSQRRKIEHSSNLQCSADSIIEVRYESLLQDTEDEAQRVCRFLDVEYQPSMLEPADERTRRIFGWENHKAWDRIIPQNTSRSPERSSVVEAYLREWIEHLRYNTESVPQGASYAFYRVLAEVRLLYLKAMELIHGAGYRLLYGKDRQYLMLAPPTVRDVLRRLLRVRDALLGR